MTTHRFYSFPVTSCVHFVHNCCPSISQRKLQNCLWDNSMTSKPQQENNRAYHEMPLAPPHSSNQWLLSSGQFGRQFQDYTGWYTISFFISQHREMTGYMHGRYPPYTHPHPHTILQTGSRHSGPKKVWNTVNYESSKWFSWWLSLVTTSKQQRGGHECPTGRNTMNDYYW